MCFACAMNAGTRRPASSARDPGELACWSPGDAARAATVCRQLPRWSSRLLRLLSSAPGRRFPASEVQASLIAEGDPPFGVEDACDWAAVFCAASGRQPPVRRETLASGATEYWMEQPAARLFQGVIAHPPG